MMIVYMQSLSCLLYLSLMLTIFKVDSLEYWATVSFIIANQACFYFGKTK